MLLGKSKISGEFGADLKQIGEQYGSAQTEG